MTATQLTASPTKLRNGSWGARVNSAQVAQGQQIQVTARSGKTWTATVTRVLWAGEGVAICATAKSGQSSPSRSTRKASSYRCHHCGGQRTRDYCPGFDCDGDI